MSGNFGQLGPYPAPFFGARARGRNLKLKGSKSSNLAAAVLPGWEMVVVLTPYLTQPHHVRLLYDLCVGYGLVTRPPVCEDFTAQEIHASLARMTLDSPGDWVPQTAVQHLHLADRGWIVPDVPKIENGPCLGILGSTLEVDGEELAEVIDGEAMEVIFVCPSQDDTELSGTLGAASNTAHRRFLKTGSFIDTFLALYYETGNRRPDEGVVPPAPPSDDEWSTRPRQPLPRETLADFAARRTAVLSRVGEWHAVPEVPGWTMLYTQTQRKPRRSFGDPQENKAVSATVQLFNVTRDTAKAMRKVTALDHVRRAAAAEAYLELVDGVRDGRYRQRVRTAWRAAATAAAKWSLALEASFEAMDAEARSHAHQEQLYVVGPVSKRQRFV